jgi:perosamine synthetase
MHTEHDPESYPRPKFPILPVLSWDSFSIKPRQQFTEHIPSVLDVEQRVELISGTAAITLALQTLGISGGDNVLLPSYHCYAMVEPVLAVKACPNFYNIRPDLSCDIDDIRTKINDNTRAILFTHYFGFAQHIHTIRELCEHHDIALIEDCAHAYFGQTQGKSMGSHGDFAIASVSKFFPVADGGYLLSAKGLLGNVQVDSSGAIYNLKAALDALEEAVHYGRPQNLRWLVGLPMTIKEILRRMIKPVQSGQEPGDIGPDTADEFQYLNVASINKRMSLVTQILVNKVSHGRIIQKRRENYLHLLKELGDLKGGRPLFRELPDDVVPYKFPFLVDQHETMFPALKNHAVPIFRWEDLKKTDCTVSAAYSRNLLQLPCHQEMTDDEMSWMIDTIRLVCN